MKVFLEMMFQFWYLWLFIIILWVLSLFSAKIKGCFGEKSTAHFLSRLDKTKYKVINNIMLQRENKTSQIDHVIISNFGVFVIETKNYKGWIIGNEYDDYWKQVIYKRKEKLYNPIKQNFGHINTLKEVLKDFPDLEYIPIVAFTTNAELKVNTKTDVVYTIKLLKTIRKYNNKIISDPMKEEIYEKLISLNIDSKENRKKHIENIHDNLFDKNEEISNDICPRCGGKLVIRKGKYGEFKGCSNYPKCKFTVK